MKRIGILACWVLVALNARVMAEADKMVDSLSVRIVACGVGDGQPEHAFHVLVTNRSDQPVRLWREWCSWGYFSLSLVMTDESGRVTVVRKLQRGWDKNFPSWVAIAPGDHMLWRVSLDPTIWSQSPVPATGKFLQIKMKVVFEIYQDDESKEFNVWTGKVESPEGSYTLYRLRGKPRLQKGEDG